MPEPELLVRAFENFELRAEGDEWTVEGIAVPWGQTIEVGGIKERFERGAFGDFAGGAPFYADHLHRFGHLPVGRVVASENRDAGQWVKVLISRTAAGSDVYTLLRDKVLPGLSVGFKPLADRQDQGVTVRTRATFGEVSATAFPAYSQAAVTDVRHRTDREDNMPTTTAPEAVTEADLAELRSTIADMERQMAVLADGGSTGGGSPAPSKFRSLGHFAKALATGEATAEDAEALSNAYEAAMTGEPDEVRALPAGATTTMLGTTLRPSWIDRDVKLVQSNRRIFELFSSERLPAEGMTVAYPKFGSATGDVGKQANEADDLNYIELAITSDSAPVETYGGWSQLSRQVIERAQVPYLNKVLAFQKISYGKITNGVIRTKLTGATSTNTDTLLFADKGKGIAWTNAVLNAAAAFETNSAGLSPDAWIMGLTHFSQLASIVDSSGRPVFVLNGDGQNTFGSVDLRGLKANVAGIPVFLDPGLTGTFSYIASRDAITTLESGPFNLADENIVKLTKAFSIYGYLAATVNDPKGITKISHPAA